MARGLISPDIPGIHARALDALTANYATRDEAMTALDEIEAHYKSTDYYPGHGEQISQAVQTLKEYLQPNGLPGPEGGLDNTSQQYRSYLFTGLFPLPRW